MARIQAASSKMTSLAILLCYLLSLISFVQGARESAKKALNSDALVPLRTHSIAPPYVDSNLQNKFWDFGGDAIIDTSRHIRLTQDKRSQAGWLWSRSRLNPMNYQINIEYKIDGHSPHLFGDGFAMWLTEDRAEMGPVFGSKDRFNGVGLIFDTYANGKHPYTFPRVMLLSGDGHQSYDLSEDGANMEVGGCSAEIRRANVATKARLTYVRGAYLELQLHHDDWEEWETCFELTNVTLPQHPFVGFTSVTGDVSDNHDIISVETHSIIHKAKTPEELRAERDAQKEADSAGRLRHSRHRASEVGIFSTMFSLVFTVFKWAVVLAVLAGLVVAGLRFKRKQDAKRF